MRTASMVPSSLAFTSAYRHPLPPQPGNTCPSRAGGGRWLHRDEDAEGKQGLGGAGGSEGSSPWRAAGPDAGHCSGVRSGEGLCWPKRDLHQNWAGTHGGALTQPLGSWLSRFVGIGELDLCAPGAEGAWSMQGCCRDKMRAGRKCLHAGSFTSARSAQV